MKKMMTALMALFLMAGTSAFARNVKSNADGQRPTVEQMARNAAERMTAQLKLTEAQTEQVYEATLERLRLTESLREQARAAKAEEAEKMKSILSTEQFMRWSRLQGQGGRGHGPQIMKNDGAKGTCNAERGEAPKARRGKK